MMQSSRPLLPLFLVVVLLNVPKEATAAVDSVTGDTGGAQTGAIIISGGTSGAIFNSSTSTITESFNYLSMPLTTSVNGQIRIANHPILHNFGNGNQNLFVGEEAGNFSTTGGDNTACGASALALLTSGSSNTAVGHASLVSITSGLGNTALGSGTALSLTTGNNNVLIGGGAGGAYTSDESNNIIVGAGNPGVQGESNVIRIGTGGQQTDFYADGIYGSTIDFDTGLPVYIDAVGKVGTLLSSARFKKNIKDMGNRSSSILKLRPVTFCGKSDNSTTVQFGLIAEEVNEVMPELVVKDANGEPYAVRYFELPVLLVNEFQKMEKHIDKLEDTIKNMSKRIEKLEAQCKIK